MQEMTNHTLSTQMRRQKRRRGLHCMMSVRSRRMARGHGSGETAGILIRAVDLMLVV